jgi:hypothetical protein
MRTTRTIFAIISTALLVGSASPASARTAPERAADKSDNVELVATFPYVNESQDFFSGGTDIAFSGKYIYAMQQGNANGGVHVIKQGSKPKKVAFIPCPGEQNDVAVVKPGLIALAYHSSTCGGAPGAGVRLVDVKNPNKPKLLGVVETPGGTHTLTVYPGEPIIYASPGGLPTNGGAVEQIIDVSNPAKPEIAATFKPNNSGCHDLSFYFDKDTKIAACPGEGEAQIWDVSDPLAPVTIGRIVQPFNQFNHSAEFTHDGKYMVLGEEAIVGNDCVGGPTGALWIYDMADPTLPVPLGYYGIDRGPLPVGSSNYNRNTWCTSHLFNFIPGTYTLVTSWYAAGMNVIDWSDPSAPVEVAHYMGTGEDITNYWSAYWYDGRIWANDRVKGLDVFEVKGLKEGK